MPLNANALKDWVFEPRHQTYTDRETMLYALSVGFGADPMNARELPFIYERDLKTVPTMAAVLCHLGAWNTDPRTGITVGDYANWTTHPNNPGKVCAAE